MYIPPYFLPNKEPYTFFQVIFRRIIERRKLLEKAFSLDQCCLFCIDEWENSRGPKKLLLQVNSQIQKRNSFGFLGNYWKLLLRCSKHQAK